MMLSENYQRTLDVASIELRIRRGPVESLLQVLLCYPLAFLALAVATQMALADVEFQRLEAAMSFQELPEFGT